MGPLGGESVLDFNRTFPDEATALTWMFERRFGGLTACKRCRQSLTWRADSPRGMRSTSECCGRPFHLRAGSFAGSSNLSLRTHFLAILMSSNADGMVSSLFLGRHLGLSEKACQRLAKWVRIHQTALVLRDWSPMVGTVCVDEMKMSAVVDSLCAKDAPVSIFGIANVSEARFFIVPDRRATTLRPIILANVAPGSTIVADGFAAYDSLSRAGYRLSRVNHSRGEWKNVSGHTTALIETCWRTLRYRIQGVHRHVRSDYLWSYLGQQMFVLKCRKAGLSPFWESLENFPAVRAMVPDLRSQIDRRGAIR